MKKLFTLILFTIAVTAAAQKLPPEEHLEYAVWYDNETHPSATMSLQAQQAGKTDYRIAASLKSTQSGETNGKPQIYCGATVDPEKALAPRTAYETVISNKNWRTTEYIFSDGYVDAKTFKDKDAKRIDTRFLYPDKPRDVLSAIWMLRWHNYDNGTPVIQGGILSGNETEDLSVKPAVHKKSYINGVRTSLLEIAATRQGGTKLTITVTDDTARTPVSFSYEGPGRKIYGLLVMPENIDQKNKALMEAYGILPKMRPVTIEPCI